MTKQEADAMAKEIANANCGHPAWCVKFNDKMADAIAAAILRAHNEAADRIAALEAERDSSNRAVSRELIASRSATEMLLEAQNRATAAEAERDRLKARVEKCSSAQAITEAEALEGPRHG